MGKSKQTTVFSLSNGEKVVFDQTAFQYVVNLKAKEIDRKSGKSRGGQVEVFRKLAQGLEPYNEKPTEAAISKIKNWYYDNNGPSDIDDIRKIATILDCKDNTFLKDYSEVNTMNTVNDTVNLNINQTDVIQALKNGSICLLTRQNGKMPLKGFRIDFQLPARLRKHQCISPTRPL